MLRRSARTIVPLAAVTAVALAACTSSGGSSRSPHPTRAAQTSTHSTSASPSRQSSPAPSPADIRAAARKQLRAVIAHQPKHGVSVAALDLTTGAKYATGTRSGMWTASVYKLFVLETLLWQQHGALGGSEADGAVPMIEQSDNAEGYELWEDADGNSGLAAAAKRFGMTHTQAIGTDPTFTRTSAPDLLKLVEVLVDKHGPLTAPAKKQALYLMRNVDRDERWGVSAAADRGSTFYLKNGWLSIDDSNGPGEDDGGRWAVNSVGIVTSHHHRLLLAVMTEHQPDFQTGVDLVEKLARLVDTATTGIPTPARTKH